MNSENQNEKTILIINEEDSRENMGYNKAGVVPEIDEPFCHVVNLITKVAKICNHRVVYAFHEDLTEEFMNRVKPDCMIGSGRARQWNMEGMETEYRNLFRVLRKGDIPFLGICAGHQLLGYAYHATLAPIRTVPEPLLDIGYQDIKIIQDDPLFKGFDGSACCMLYHSEELKNIPEGFSLLASTDICKIQAIKHNEYPLYGVQFHPEFYNDGHLDGKRVLENFIDLYC